MGSKEWGVVLPPVMFFLSKNKIGIKTAIQLFFPVSLVRYASIQLAQWVLH